MSGTLDQRYLKITTDARSGGRHRLTECELSPFKHSPPSPKRGGGHQQSQPTSQAPIQLLRSACVGVCATYAASAATRRSSSSPPLSLHSQQSATAQQATATPTAINAPPASAPVHRTPPSLPPPTQRSSLTAVEPLSPLSSTALLSLSVSLFKRTNE